MTGGTASPDRRQIWYPVWDSGPTSITRSERSRQARQVAAQRPQGRARAAVRAARGRRPDADRSRLREGALGGLAGRERADRPRRAETRLHEERWRQASRRLAFLLEPDLKEVARRPCATCTPIQAIAAAWVAARPRPQGTRRPRPDASTRAMCFTRSPAAARDVRRVLGAGRGGPHPRPARPRRAAPRSWRQRPPSPTRSITRFRSRSAAGGQRSASGCAGASWTAGRLPTALVEQGGEVARPRASRRTIRCSCCARPAAAAQVACRSPPVRWPGSDTRRCRCRGRAAARDALLALLGAGSTADAVWEALDQEGLLAALPFPTGTGCATARSATRCTASPSTGTWSSRASRRRPGPRRLPPGPAAARRPAARHRQGLAGDHQRVRRGRGPRRVQAGRPQRGGSRTLSPPPSATTCCCRSWPPGRPRRPDDRAAGRQHGRLADAP